MLTKHRKPKKGELLVSRKEDCRRFKTSELWVLARFITLVVVLGTLVFVGCSSPSQETDGTVETSELGSHQEADLVQVASGGGGLPLTFCAVP